MKIGGCCVLHRPHLHRRGVGAQDHVLGPGRQRRAARRRCRTQSAVGSERRGVDVEGVLGHPRRVPGRVVEGGEVVVVELDLGALHDPVAEPDEDVLDLAAGADQQVQVAERHRRGAGQGHVDRVGGQARRRARPPRAPRARSRAAPPAPPGPRFRPRRRRRAARPGSSAIPRRIAGQLGLAAQVANPQLLQRGGVAARRRSPPRPRARSSSIRSRIVSASGRPCHGRAISAAAPMAAAAATLSDSGPLGASGSSRVASHADGDLRRQALALGAEDRSTIRRLRSPSSSGVGAVRDRARAAARQSRRAPRAPAGAAKTEPMLARTAFGE